MENFGIHWYAIWSYALIGVFSVCIKVSFRIKIVKKLKPELTRSFDLCFTLIRTGIRTSDSRSFKTFKMKYLYSKMVGHTRRRLILHLKYFVVYREKIFVRFFLFSRGLNFLFTTMHCSMFIICGTFPSKCFSFF